MAELWIYSKQQSFKQSILIFLSTSCSSIVKHHIQVFCVCRDLISSMQFPGDIYILPISTELSIKSNNVNMYILSCCWKLWEMEEALPPLKLLNKINDIFLHK